MKKIAENIKKYGQHLVAVGASINDSKDFIPFIYTIGNHEKGLPELLLIGDCDDIYGQILNILGDIQRERKESFFHGQKVDFTAKFPAYVIDAGDRGRNEYAVQVGVYYKTDDFKVLQILLPDQNGKYPTEAGCLYPYSLQPILSPNH